MGGEKRSERGSTARPLKDDEPLKVRGARGRCNLKTVDEVDAVKGVESRDVFISVVI